VIAYLDSSTILRIVLGQANAFKEWRSITQGVVSALVEVECLRTLDRLRLAEGLKDAEIAARRETVFRLLEAIEVVELTRPILSRAAQPLPTTLGTLDAIHLATALLWKEQTRSDLVMATHDEGLATASRASGLRVVGVSASV
jgi:predicted nucleic acid-binding protein